MIQCPWHAQLGGFLLTVLLLLSLPSASRELDQLDPQATELPQIREAQDLLLGIPKA